MNRAVARRTPGGLVLNADLLHNPEERHLSLLSAHGFQGSYCTLEIGSFGCLMGFA